MDRKEGICHISFDSGILKPIQNLKPATSFSVAALKWSFNWPLFDPTQQDCAVNTFDVKILNPLWGTQASSLDLSSSKWLWH